MSYNILTIPPFDKQIKRLVKKYPSLKQEFTQLVSELVANPEIGTPLGNNCYKIRLSIASKGKGKRGGARIITNLVVTEHTVFLLTIYDKSETNNITDTELKELLSNIPL